MININLIEAIYLKILISCNVCSKSVCSAVDKGQKEIFTVVMVATRLLQSSDLAQTWAKDQGEALAQLMNLRDSILV